MTEAAKKEMHSIDDALVKDMNHQLAMNSGVTPEPEVANPTPQEPEVQPEVAEQTEEPEVKEPEKVEKVEKTEKSEKAENKDNPIDEYGNPVEKPKMYTEEEVNRMMRERFSRGKYAEQTPQQQQQVQKAAEDFKADPDSAESWETQLEQFIDRTIEKKQRATAEEQWRQQQIAKQAEFESKFTQGMSKYADFHATLQPLADRGALPDSIMFATRALDNPAAFLYGAAKLHPQELERIAKIPDPYVQAAEVGRLHEKMVKTRNVNSSAARPIEPSKQDVPVKQHNQPSLEDRIHQYAKQKRR